MAADAALRVAGLDLRVEAAQLFIMNSYRVNDYLGLLGQDAVASRGRGLYAHAAYDLLDLAGVDTRQRLVLFAGYENVNPRSKMSAYNYNPPAIVGPGEVSPKAPSPAKSFIRAGIVYHPHPTVALKADIQLALGDEGPAPAPPTTVMGAPGTPVPLPPELAEAARGRSRVGLGLAFTF